MATADEIAKALGWRAEPLPLELIEQVSPRNRPLAPVAVALADALRSVAEAMRDNAGEDGERLPEELHQRLSDLITGADRALTNLRTYARSEALVAIPAGHRLPTNLDRHD